MKAAIYYRVSTDDQEKEGTSLHTQRDACIDYCKQKGYQVARQFSETFSGLTLDRPELIKLRVLIRANDIDVVVVYCLDRLSRNATHGVILRDELDRHHTSLESVTEDIDKTPLGEAITYLRGTFAQIEAEKIRERTMRGKLARLKEGKLPHGTGIGIYGYQWHKDTGRRTIIDHEVEVVQRTFTLVLAGFSFYRIALQLNKEGIKSKSGSAWNPLTIRRIASNETYTGKTYSGKTKRTAGNKVTTRPKEEWFLLPDVTPAIIDDETFKRAQDIINQKKQSRPVKPNSPYLLTGFAKCSKCGSPLGGTTLNGKYRYYQCRGARPTATRDKICDARYIKADALENDVWTKFIKMAFGPKTLIAFLMADKFHSQNTDIKAVLNKQISSLRKRLKAYEKKEKNLISLLAENNVTKEYVIESINRLKQERTSDEIQLVSLLEARKKHSSNNTRVKLSDLWEQTRKLAIEAVDPEDLPLRRDILERLRLQVIADQKTFSFTFGIEGYLTSSDEESLSDFINDKYFDFEKQHPEISLDEIIDPNVLLPEDSYFARILNPVKKRIQLGDPDLVTIEQTSA